MTDTEPDNTGSVHSVLDAVLAELREQGLTVRLHNTRQNTWHIADGGLYGGYVVSSEELFELRRANKLNIRGIQELD